MLCSFEKLILNYEKNTLDSLTWVVANCKLQEFTWSTMSLKKVVNHGHLFHFIAIKSKNINQFPDHVKNQIKENIAYSSQHFNWFPSNSIVFIENLTKFAWYDKLTMNWNE